MYTPTFSRLFVYLSVLFLAASASAKPTRVAKNRLPGSVAKRAVQSDNPLKQLTIKRPPSHRLAKRATPSAVSINAVQPAAAAPAVQGATIPLAASIDISGLTSIASNAIAGTGSTPSSNVVLSDVGLTLSDSPGISNVASPGNTPSISGSIAGTGTTPSSGVGLSDVGLTLSNSPGISNVASPGTTPSFSGSIAGTGDTPSSIVGLSGLGSILTGTDLGLSPSLAGIISPGSVAPSISNPIIGFTAGTGDAPSSNVALSGLGPTFTGTGTGILNVASSVTGLTSSNVATGNGPSTNVNAVVNPIQQGTGTDNINISSPGISETPSTGSNAAVTLNAPGTPTAPGTNSIALDGAPIIGTADGTSPTTVGSVTGASTPFGVTVNAALTGLTSPASGEVASPGSSVQGLTASVDATATTVTGATSDLLGTINSGVTSNGNGQTNVVGGTVSAAQQGTPGGTVSVSATGPKIA